MRCSLPCFFHIYSKKFKCTVSTCSCEDNEYPIENVFTIQNAQLRSYAINAIGLEKVLAPYPTKVIDTETIIKKALQLLK